MGCCISTNPSSHPPKPPQKISKNTNITKSPPPSNPLPEEETVKEVLSETRTFPKTPSPLVQTSRDYESPFIKNAPLLFPDFSRNSNAHRNGVVSKKPFMAFPGDDSISENVSEICSTLGESESMSVSTSVTEKRDDRNDVGLRENLRQRSPARRKNNTSFSGEVWREKAVGRSPGRRPEPSPSRNRPGSGNAKRRDNGDSSGRRSRSPVTRTDLGRSPSARKTGKSPGRVGSGSGERIRKVEDGKENGDHKWPPTSDESLENPLVSLECFIFL